MWQCGRGDDSFPTCAENVLLFFYLCGICGHDDVMMVMMLVLMVLSLLVWNMWTDSVAVRHQWQTALHQTVIFIFISFNLFIYLSLYLYLYLNRYTEQDHHHFWNIISITMNRNKWWWEMQKNITLGWQRYCLGEQDFCEHTCTSENSRRISTTSEHKVSFNFQIGWAHIWK